MSLSTIADCAAGASMRPDNVTATPFVPPAPAGPASPSLRGVLAHHGRRPPDPVHVERRRLVKLIDPVAEQQMCVTAPAVFRLAGRIVLRKIVPRQRNRLTRRDVAEILVSQRTRVVLDMIEHMQRTMRGIVQQA